MTEGPRAHVIGRGFGRRKDGTGRWWSWSVFVGLHCRQSAPARGQRWACADPFLRPEVSACDARRGGGFAASASADGRVVDVSGHELNRSSCGGPAHRITVVGGGDPHAADRYAQAVPNRRPPKPNNKRRLLTVGGGTRERGKHPHMLAWRISWTDAARLPPSPRRALGIVDGRFPTCAPAKGGIVSEQNSEAGARRDGLYGALPSQRSNRVIRSYSTASSAARL